MEKVSCHNCKGAGKLNCSGKLYDCPICKTRGWNWRQFKVAIKINENNIELTGVFLDEGKIPPIWSKRPYYEIFDAPIDEVVRHKIIDIPDAEAEVIYLRDRVRTLRDEIHRKDEVLHRKNIELDAMHWVWCDGGCETGTHRFTEDDLTEEVVKAAESNTARLRRWFNNKR
jgi:hypothetical protein